jgi:hypothetical protein
MCGVYGPVWVSGRRLYAAVAVAFLNFVLCGTFCHSVKSPRAIAGSHDRAGPFFLQACVCSSHALSALKLLTHNT